MSQISFSLYSNAEPSAQLKSLIQDRVAGLDVAIFEIDRKIASLETEMARQEVIRAAYIKECASYLPVLSYLRTLPVEILGEIFVWAYRDAEDSRLTVSHVCQRWRQVALYTRELWTTVPLALNHRPQAMPTRDALDPGAEYFHACVERAGRRPLTLTRPFRYENDLAEFTMPASVLRSIKTNQWKKVEWNGRGFYFTDLLACLNTISSDTLGCLILNNYRRRDSDDSIWSVGSNLNNSRTVVINSSFRYLSKLTIGIYFPIRSRTLSAPWSQLTELTLAAPRIDKPETLYKILRQCPKLEFFEFELASTRGLDHIYVEEAQINLSRLHCLRLIMTHKYCTSMISTVTNALRTPVLDELVVSTPGIMSAEEGEDLRYYLGACATTLRRLWMSGWYDFRPQAFDIRGLHALEELTLVGADHRIWNHFPTLALENHRPLRQRLDYLYPLPNLRVLNVISYSHTAFLQDDFIDIVQSRWWPGIEDRDPYSCPVARLRQTSLQLEDLPDSILVSAQVERLRQEGLKIDVRAFESEEFVPGFPANGSS